MSEKKEPTPKKISDEEVMGMLQRMRDIDSSLKQQVEEIYTKSGLSYHQIDVYLENETNFPPGLWRKLRDQAEELEGQLAAIFGKKDKARKITVKTKKMTKERKGKTLGARKGWIPMK